MLKHKAKSKSRDQDGIKKAGQIEMIKKDVVKNFVDNNDFMKLELRLSEVYGKISFTLMNIDPEYI